MPLVDHSSFKQVWSQIDQEAYDTGHFWVWYAENWARPKLAALRSEATGCRTDPTDGTLVDLDTFLQRHERELHKIGSWKGFAPTYAKYIGGRFWITIQAGAGDAQTPAASVAAAATVVAVPSVPPRKAEVLRVLREANLEDFADRLFAQGWDQVELLPDLTKEDFEALGFGNGHIAKLRKALAFDTRLDGAVMKVWESLGETEVAHELATLSWQGGSAEGLQLAALEQSSAAFRKVRQLWQLSGRTLHLSRVELLSAPLRAQMFLGMMQTLGWGRGDGASGPLNPRNFNDTAFTSGLDKLKTLFVDGRKLPRHGNIIYTWHGMDSRVAHETVATGIRPLRSTDGGYFGGGSYTAIEAWYACQYAMPPLGSARPNASGEFVVALCATVIGAAYVVTLDRDYTGQEKAGFSDFFADHPKRSKAIVNYYDTHFVPVKHYGNRWRDQTLPYDVDYQAIEEPQAEAHEVVSYSFDQIIPLALVYFKQSRCGAESAATRASSSM